MLFVSICSSAQRQLQMMRRYTIFCTIFPGHAHRTNICNEPPIVCDRLHIFCGLNQLPWQYHILTNYIFAVFLGASAGSPINRLPIMAKSVLDLFELYNLVIARGGLVDVINKKLWQEIIKGLQLPSSITSAAFTLRTQ